MVLVALVGAGAAVAQPAEFALIPSVADGNLRRANSYVEALRALGFALGPLAGGFLAAAGGMKLGLLVDSASFVLLAVIAAALPSAPRVPRAGAAPERARDGIVFLGRDATLRLVLGVGFFSLLFMTASAPAEVFFAKDVLEAGDVGFGLLWGAWTVAMACGGLVLSRRLGGVGVALLMIVVQSAGLAIPTLWLSLALACALYFVGGAAHGTKNVLLRTLASRRSSSAGDRLGRRLRDSPWDVLGCTVAVCALSQGLSLSGGVTSQRQSEDAAIFRAHRR